MVPPCSLGVSPARWLDEGVVKIDLNELHLNHNDAPHIPETSGIVVLMKPRGGHLAIGLHHGEQEDRALRLWRSVMTVKHR